MLTPRGRTLVAMSAVLLAVGRVLALRELSMLGAALGAVVAFGAVAVIARRGTLRVSRGASPSRAPAEAEVRVTLEIRNEGRWGSGPLLCEDGLPEVMRATARLTLPPLRPGASRQVAYTIRPPLRGHYSLGPLEIAITDPFGCVLRKRKISGTSRVIVYPSFDRLTTLPKGVRRLGAVRTSPLIGAGDEFYALREYQEGDDLRKVHWPTSARTGELLVRQDELLREPRVFVVLDTCAAKHRGVGAAASIEAAVSVGASVGVLAIDRRMRLEVYTSDGPLTEGSRPSDEELLDALAGVRPSEAVSLEHGLLGLPPRRIAGAGVVLITPGLSRRELGVCARLFHAAAGGVTVLISAPTFGREHAPGQRRIAEASASALLGIGLPVVTLRAGQSFRTAWETGVRGVALAR